jgi:uncharacterized protein involved in exopolysaccharide biosynthesis
MSENKNRPLESASLSATPEAAAVRRLFTFLVRNIFILAAGVAAGIVLGLLVQNFLPPTYEADGSFLVDEVPFLQNAAPNANLEAQTESDLVQSLIINIPSVDMRHAMAARLGVAERQLCFEDLSPRPLSLRSKELVANIRITSVHNTRTATISVTSQSPRFAAQVVKALLAELDNYNLAQGRLNALKIDISFTADRIENLRLQLAHLEETRGLEQQQVAQLVEYQKGGLPLSSFPVFATDTTLNNLKTQQLLAQSDYAALAANSSGGFPLEGKKAEVANIENDIKRQAQALAEGLRSQLAGTKAQEASVQAELRDNQEKIRQLSQQRVDWVQSFGDLSLMKSMLSTNAVNEASPGSVIVISDRTVSSDLPKSPKLSLNLAAGIFVGGLAGLMIAFGRSLLDDRLVSAKIVAPITHIPCVAAAPYRFSLFGKKVLSAQPLDPAGFDPLRSRLLLAAGEGKSQVIGFTPAAKWESASPFVARLAVMLAQAGHRVLVVDLHFGKSRQAPLLDVKIKRGLSEWLASEDPIDDYIVPSAQDKLALLACAPGKNAATRILARRPLVKIMPQLQSSWDFILIDSPAIIKSWDLALVLPANSPLVITANRGITRAPRVVQTAERAHNQNWNVVGVALKDC